MTLLLLGCVAVQSRDLAMAGVLFSDDFTGPALNSAWQVLPGYGGYNVSGDQLRYYGDGPLAATTGWYNAALTLALPFTGTNWEVDVKATYGLSWCLSGNYTGPSTPNQGCSSGAQDPKVIVKFDPGITTSTFGGPNYAGTDFMQIERLIDAYYGANALYASYGSISSANVLNPADLNINNNIADGTYWYRIIRNGGALTADYSIDGVNYLTAFSTTLSNPSSTYNELLIGGNTYLSAGSYTDYDFVRITGPVPEPATFVPLSVCLAGLGFSWLRKKRMAPSDAECRR